MLIVSKSRNPELKVVIRSPGGPPHETRESRQFWVTILSSFPQPRCPEPACLAVPIVTLLEGISSIETAVLQTDISPQEALALA